MSLTVTFTKLFSFLSFFTFKNVEHKLTVSISLAAILGFFLFSCRLVRDVRHKKNNDEREKKEITPLAHFAVKSGASFCLSFAGVVDATPEKCQQSSTLVELGSFNGKQLRVSSRKYQSTKTLRGLAKAASVSFSSARTEWTEGEYRSDSVSLQPLSSFSSTDSMFVATVGCITVPVAMCFSMEKATYHFPTDMRQYVHADGSRLIIVAENLDAVEGDVTTVSYTKNCIGRLRQEAALRQTYFKVRHDIAASNIVTTIMERFVNISIGSYPMSISSFFLVRDDMAYTIQLQTTIENYEDRLIDFFPTLQRARIDRIHRTSLGQVCHALRSTMRNEVFVVCMPLQFVATRTPSGNALTLRCRRVSGWSGKVFTCDQRMTNSGTSVSSDSGSGGGDGVGVAEKEDVVTLITGKVYLASYWHIDAGQRAVIVEKMALLLAAVSASPAQECDNSLPPSRYISDRLEIQLPACHIFTTNVCSHYADPFVNLFVTTRDAEMFEVEIGTAHFDKAIDFAAFAEALFLKPPMLHLEETAAGVQKLTALGEAKNNVTLRLDAMQSTDVVGLWYIVKSLHAVGLKMPTELVEYITSILEGSFFC